MLSKFSLLTCRKSILRTSLVYFTSKSAKMSENSIVYVYSGLGVNDDSKHHLYTSLKQNLSLKHQVSFITPAEVIQGSWQKNAAAIALGGGFDLGFIKALGKEGIKNIRTFVAEGGTYLGFCAGGYFGCDSIEFDKGGPLQVCGDRDLGFFPGLCRGPSYPGFEYNNMEKALAAPVDFEINSVLQTSLRIFFHGGGHFILPQSRKRSGVLEVLEGHTKQPKKSLDNDDAERKNHMNGEIETLRNQPLVVTKKSTNVNGNHNQNSTVKTQNNNQIPMSKIDQTSSENVTKNKTCNRTMENHFHQNSDSISKLLSPNSKVKLQNDTSETVNREVKIVAKYNDLPGQPAAIVVTKYGKGTSLLTGVHIEYIPTLLKQTDSNLKTLLQILENNERKRVECFKALLQLVGLETCPNDFTTSK